MSEMADTAIDMYWNVTGRFRQGIQSLSKRGESR
jgi:hypothetical protein